MKTHCEIRQVNGKRVATPEYRSWQMMKNRCLNPKARDYAYYGGRGIGICPDWMQYENFLRDMGRKPTPAHTLERNDGNGAYGPKNCTWETRKTQSRNRAYASTKAWELEALLQLRPATVRHYLWVVRSEQKGQPTRYTIPDAARQAINKHLENLK